MACLKTANRKGGADASHTARFVFAGIPRRYNGASAVTSKRLDGKSYTTHVLQDSATLILRLDEQQEVLFSSFGMEAVPPVRVMKEEHDSSTRGTLLFRGEPA